MVLLDTVRLFFFKKNPGIGRASLKLLKYEEQKAKLLCYQIVVILALCVYQISRTNLPSAIISLCAIIDFWSFSHPVRLFHAVRLFDTQDT